MVRPSPTLATVIPYRCSATGQHAQLLASIESALGVSDAVIVVDDNDKPTSEPFTPHPNLSFYHGGGIGCASARNLGRRIAQTEYVAYLDVGDVFWPNKRDQMEWMHENNYLYSFADHYSTTRRKTIQIKPTWTTKCYERNKWLLPTTIVRRDTADDYLDFLWWHSDTEYHARTQALYGWHHYQHVVGTADVLPGGHTYQGREAATPWARVRKACYNFTLQAIRAYKTQNPHDWLRAKNDRACDLYEMIYAAQAQAVTQAESKGDENSVR